MIDASSGGALMNKTPEEAWELIEIVADTNQHFKTRAMITAYLSRKLKETKQESRGRRKQRNREQRKLGLKLQNLTLEQDMSRLGQVLRLSPKRDMTKDTT
ncbi:hypothetical protein PIB30_085049 [Stylosanthes scabra]|uniref:Uncharacterized protein n=1 Tax=Stylosanthes scabra TaxID=79078 RepID=A0ABU6STT3_9FABA|nr:hypothetical protein [Stylosanthes scabra]